MNFMSMIATRQELIKVASSCPPPLQTDPLYRSPNDYACIDVCELQSLGRLPPRSHYEMRRDVVLELAPEQYFLDDRILVLGVPKPQALRVLAT
jgi:hypothetical protein